MLDRDVFSKGANGKVYQISEQDKVLYPHADLDKYNNDTSSREAGFFQFYNHQIAKLIFPNNFINVYSIKGDEVQIPTGYQNDYIIAYRFHTYSELADTHPDHATYAAHYQMVKNRKRRRRWDIHWPHKRSYCKCEVCMEHKVLHDKIKPRVRRLADKIANAGIGVPVEDRSDYCIKPDGTVMFYEIDDIDAKKMHGFLEKPAGDIDQDRVRRLLERQQHYRDIHIFKLPNLM